MVVLLIILQYATMSDKAMEWFFNTDSLYLPSIYKDLFQDGGSLKGWHLNHAPGFFPDMPLFFLSTALGWSNYIIGTLLFGVFQYLIILFGLKFIFKQFNITEKALVIFNFIFAIAIFSFTKHDYENWFYMTFLLLSNAYHLGAFVNALLGISLILKYLKSNNIAYLVLLFMLSVIALISDKLFVINFSIVIIGFVVIIGIIRKKIERNSTLIIATILASTVVGWFLSDYLENLGYYHIITAENKVFNWSGIPVAWSHFIRGVKELFTPFSRYSVLTLAAGLSFVTAVFRLASKLKNKRASEDYLPEVFTVIFVLITLFTPVLSGAFTGMDAFRYNMPAFIVLWIYLSIQIAQWKWNPKIVSAVGLIGITSAFVAFGINHEQWSKNINYYPEIAQQVDSLTDVAGVKYGVAEYWVAKNITLFSRSGIRVYTAYDVMTPWYHVMNQNWFYHQIEDPSKPVDFEFIVYTSPNQKKRCDELFGTDYDSIGVETKLLLTPNFRFNPETYQAYSVD